MSPAVAVLCLQRTGTTHLQHAHVALTQALVLLHLQHANTKERH